MDPDQIQPNTAPSSSDTTPELTYSPAPSSGEPVTSTGEGTPSEAAPASTPVMPSAAEIGASVATALQQQAPAAQPTEEEIQAQLRVWQPDTQFTEAFATVMTDSEATPEDRQQAFIAMRDGMMQQSTRAAELMVQSAKQELMKTFQPAQEFMAQQRADAAHQAFATQYPALKEQRQLVDMVSDQVAAQGIKFQSQQEAYEFVAKQTEQILKQSNPNFNLGTPSAQQPQGMPQMASTQVVAPAQQTPSASSNGLVKPVW